MVISFMSKPKNTSFLRKLQSVRYNAALAITGAIQETSNEELSGARF